MSPRYTTDQQLRHRANTIAIVSAAIAALAAVASFLSFAIPTASAHFSEKRHEKDFVAALISSDWVTARSAQEHIETGSAADDFVQNMDKWWYSVSWLGDRPYPKPQPGSQEQVDDGYKVCLPKLLPGDPLCAKYDEFIHDPSSGLITSFSIDGIPVAKVAWEMSDGDMLTDDKEAPISAVPLFRVEFPAEGVRCVSYNLSNGTDGTIYFKPKEFEVQSLTLKKSHGRVVWPDHLGEYEKAVITLCVPTTGGFVKIERQASGKDKATTFAGWIRVE